VIAGRLTVADGVERERQQALREDGGRRFEARRLEGSGWRLEAGSSRLEGEEG